MNDLTDEQLMLLVKFDNAKAFDALYERHKRGVLGFLWRSCGDRDAAEDLLQEVFLGVHRTRGGYEPVAKFTTWLYTMARNACVSHGVRGARERARVRRVADGWRPSRAGDEPHERLQAAETEAAIEDALGRLPARQREVLLLREVSELAYEQIAEVTGWPMGTVKVELHRARRRLAELLGQRLR